MKVTVAFFTCRREEDGNAETRFTAVGILDETEAGLRLRYVEPPSAEDENDGAAVCTTVSGDRVVIERQNATLHSRMLFEAGQRHPCRYDTLYGGLDLHIVCDELKNELTTHGGCLFIRYRLDTPGVEPLETILEITLKEVSE